MKVKVKDAIEISSALALCAKLEGLNANVKYAFARNLQRLKPILTNFDEANQARVDSFAKKDEKGKAVINDGVIDFGDKAEEASQAWKKLNDEEVDFDVFTVKRSESTDNLPIEAQMILLDTVIVEK